MTARDEIADLKARLATLQAAHDNRGVGLECLSTIIEFKTKELRALKKFDATAQEIYDMGCKDERERLK